MLTAAPPPRQLLGNVSLQATAMRMVAGTYIAFGVSTTVRLLLVLSPGRFPGGCRETQRD